MLLSLKSAVLLKGSLTTATKWLGIYKPSYFIYQHYLKTKKEKCLTYRIGTGIMLLVQSHLRLDSSAELQ